MKKTALITLLSLCCMVAVRGSVVSAVAFSSSSLLESSESASSSETYNAVGYSEIFSSRADAYVDSLFYTHATSEYANEYPTRSDARWAVYPLCFDVPTDSLMMVDMSADFASYDKFVGEDPFSSRVTLNDFTLYSHDIRFKVRQTNIDRNDPKYRRLIDQIVPLMKSRNLRLHHVFVRMSASPEGLYANNVRFARGRGQALIDSLSRYIDMPDDRHIIVKVVPEDYACLYALMERSDDVDRDTVMAIIRNHASDDAATKEALRAVNGGTTWNRLEKEYFPLLRSARVIFYFTRYTLAPFDFVQGLPEAVEGQLADGGIGEKVDGTDETDKTDGTDKTNENDGNDGNDGTDETAEGDETYESQGTHESQTTEGLEIVELTKRLKEPALAVKTNLLYYGLYIPDVAYDPILNVEVEYYPRHSNWSIVGEYEFPWWVNDEGMLPTSKHHYFQLLNGQLEVRRYLNRRYDHTGHYLSAYGHAFLYDFCFDSQAGYGYQGEGWGAGLGYGFVKRLGGERSRWKLELFLKWGFLESRYDPYRYGPKYDGDGNFISAKYYYDYNGEASLFNRRNHRFRSWFRYPTGAGITLSYDLFKRKLKTKNLTPSLGSNGQ